MIIMVAPSVAMSLIQEYALKSQSHRARVPLVIKQNLDRGIRIPRLIHQRAQLEEPKFHVMELIHALLLELPVRDHAPQEHLGMPRNKCVETRDALVAVIVSYCSIAPVAAYM